jgi:hypothetical protein
MLDVYYNIITMHGPMNVKIYLILIHKGHYFYVPEKLNKLKFDKIY